MEQFYTCTSPTNVDFWTFYVWPAILFLEVDALNLPPSAVLKAFSEPNLAGVSVVMKLFHAST